jgi:Co/Zn/Cd efflux system component
VLWIILAVNAILFVAGFAAALSTALLADSLDRFGDDVVYAFTLWVLHHGCVWRVRASLSKAVVQTVFA